MDLLIVTLAALGTALATGLGAIPVFVLGQRASKLRPFLAGLAIGAMMVASIAGLLVPAARDGAGVAVAAAALLGAAFVGAARRVLEKGHFVHVPEQARGSLLVFGVLLVHSLPEGLAIGAAWASDEDGLGLFVVLAIALQNIPEGTAIALPMEAAGYSGGRQVWAAIASSLPQPVGAALAFLLVEQVESILAASLAFAGGAMIAVVALELVPDALRGKRLPAVAGAMAGAAAMLALSQALAV